ncbi:hypothetical protein DMENIID0001_103340 [Sergentomyia squamirostris]
MVHFRDADISKKSVIKVARKSPDSFINAIGPLIVVAQCLGIMPVLGVLMRNRNAVKFKWIAFRTIYSVLVLSCGLVELCLFLYRMKILGVTLHGVEGITFYGITVMGQLCFFLLATRWPKFVRCWDKVESVFLTRPYRTRERRLERSVRSLYLFWIILAFIEYNLAQCAAINGISRALEICPSTKITALEIFYRSQRPHVFMWIKYRRWMIPFLLLINMSLTFCWTYLDLFIMVTGISMAYRFKQISDRIHRMKGMTIPDSFWIEIRSHYLMMNELVLYVDKRLSMLILLSCASNLYFICLQLYNSFKSFHNDLLSAFYFWFSLLFIMSRAICALLCAASIHDSTKTPLKTIRNVSTKHWSTELSRFAYSITKDTIALTGRRFFYLTKSLVLAMAGTVVTYELVVMDQVDEKVEATNNNNSTHPCNWTIHN